MAKAKRRKLFRADISENSKIAHVFWVVARDHRKLDTYETKNVAEKAVEAGYMVEAKTTPGFKLTTAGREYYRDAIEKNLPEGFVSEKPLMTSTYYNSFPTAPRPNSNIVHVFWVIAKDFRKLSERERRNVVYPAIKAGLIEKAPEDDMGFPRRQDGELCRCRFILTEDGQRYYSEHVVPVIPEGFTSPEPPQKLSRKSETPTSALKAGT